MTDYQIVLAMKIYGGSFTKQLALAWQVADNSNQAKLKAAFPELWAQYEELTELKAGQNG